MKARDRRGADAGTPRRSPRGFVACAIYARQSVAREAGAEFTSCEAQWQACLRFIVEHNRTGELWLPTGGSFSDEGFSGATLDRPGMIRMLERIRAGAVDRVVVQRFDRLTRSVRDWIALVHSFKAHGVSLSVVSGELHEGELATSDLVLNMLASFAELEREMIGERLRDARASRQAHGRRSAGRVPFGTESDPATRQLRPVIEEAAVVHALFSQAVAGERPAALAIWANASGRHPSSSGSPTKSAWSARAVLRVLRNPVYAGGLPGQGPSVGGVHPAIVPRELFAAAKEALSRRRTREPSVRPSASDREDPFLLRGLITCQRCGRRMTTSASRGLPGGPSGARRRKEPEVPRYYRCRGPNPCPHSQVAAGALEESVVAWLREPPAGQVPESLQRPLASWMSGWPDLWPVFRQRLLRVLVREVRWDGAASTFTLLLDEEAILSAVAKDPPG